MKKAEFQKQFQKQSKKVPNTDQLERKKQSVKVYVSLCARRVPSYGSLCQASQYHKGWSSGRRPLSPVSETHDVFSNRDLPSTSGRQPRALVTACSVLGLPWTILTNPKEGFS